MAQINLSSGESFTVSGGTNTISGSTTGGETVTINGGTNVFTADFNSGGDKIILAGSASQYTVTRSGSSIILSGPNGTTVTFPAPNPNLADALNPRVTFANGGAAQDFVLDSTPAGVFTLTPTAAGSASQTITTTATTVTAPGGGGNPNPTGFTVLVTNTGGTEGGAGVTYTFTLSAAQTSAVTLFVATQGGTATAGADYTATSTSITFQPGQTVQFLTVPVIDDALVEGTENVTLSVTGATLSAQSQLTATITDNDVTAPPPPPVLPQQFILTTGNDTFTGGVANDRFVGAQDTTQPGKLLSANDVLDGGAGTDSLELTNAQNSAANNLNQLSDLDFTNVTNIETLVTNYQIVQLGREALEAGIATVDTRTRTDSQNVAAVQANFTGTALDLVSDADGNGVADFNRALTVQMANSTADVVRLQIATAAGSSIDTGSNFTFANAGGTVSPIDNIVISGQTVTGAITSEVRVTFTSTAVGNGTSFDADGTTLAVQIQSEDSTGALTGGVIRADDEGLSLTSTQAGVAFDVRDISGTQRGSFAQVILGTNANEALAGAAASVYINAGAGNDVVTGTGGADFLVGGAGNDTLNGGAGVDSLLGGAGNDVINGGAGVDALLDGGEGSDTYVFADGEFVANETITDSGVTAGDVDYLAITSSTVLADAQFAGRTGIEGLATNVTTSAIGGAVEVTLGTNAETIGVRTVYAGDDDVSATAYTAGLTVFGQGAITTGAGNDTVNLQNATAQQATLVGLGHVTSSTANQAFAGSVVLGAGDDTLNAGYALANAPATVLTGGAGNDTLTLGGALGSNVNFTLAVGTANATNAFGYTTGGTYNPIGAGFTGFENVTILAAPTNSAVSYSLTFVDANVDAGTTLVVNGSALRAGVTLAGPDGVLGTGDDLTGATAVNEVLTVNASALTGTRAVNVTGGGAADILTGGNGNDTINGGAGNDVIAGGAGNDTLLGGAGNDTLQGNAGTDTMDGGEGSDTYIFEPGTFGQFEVITDTGAAGTDTITVTDPVALTDALFANKSGVEVLTTDITTGAAADLTAAGANAEVTIGANAQAAGIRTVNAGATGAGDDDINASAYTVGLTVNTGSGSVTGGSGDDIVNLFQGTVNSVGVVTAFSNIGTNGAYRLGAGNDTFNSNFQFFGNPPQVADGGTGTDTFVYGGTYLTSGNGRGTVVADNVNFTANAIVNFERLTIRQTASDQALAIAGAPVGGNDLAGIATQLTVNIDNTGVQDNVGLTIDASAFNTGTVTALGADGELGGTGTAADTTTFSTLIVNAGGLTALKALTVIGGAGADQITAGAGNDTVNAGAGNDVVNGGAGNDTLFGEAGNDTLNGGAGTDVLDGGEGDDVLTGGDGFDTIRGGAGNDTVVLTVTQFNSDADTVDGGADNDTLQINGTASGAPTPIEIADVGFNGRFTSIEQISLVGAGPDGVVGTGDDANTAFQYTAGFYSQSAGVNTINVGANASGSTVSIANYTTGGPLNFPTPAVTLNDVAVTTNNTTFLGSGFADTFNLGGVLANGTLTGGGNDTVRAGLGDDVINFGSTLDGNDIVDGGGGTNDTLTVGVTQNAATTTAGNRIGNQATTVNLGATVVGGVVTNGIYAIDTLVLAAGRAAIDNTAPTADVVGQANSYTVNVFDSTFDGASQTVTINGTALRGDVVTTLGAGAQLDGAGFAVTNENLIVNAAAVTNNGNAAGVLHNVVVNSGAGNDNLTGGNGNDTLNGGAGNDFINGGAGNDTIDGGTGNDNLFGGLGNDTITAGAGTDTVNGGAGVDTVNLGTDGARDTVIIADGDAPRGAQAGTETITGFQTGTRGAGADNTLGTADDTFTATADVIDFGSAIMGAAGGDPQNSSVVNGVVQAGSTLATAISASTSLLAAIQLVEQEYNVTAFDNLGPRTLAFTYGGNTYIGELRDVNAAAGAITAAFTDIVQISTTTGVTGLFDVDGAGAGTALGLYI